MPPAKTHDLLDEAWNHSLGLLTQEMMDGAEDLSEILCSGFVNFSYTLTVVMESARKILLITDSGTTDTTREALWYQQGAKSSYPASHFCNSFGIKNLAKASVAPKLWNTAELILTRLLQHFKQYCVSQYYTGEWWLRKQVQETRSLRVWSGKRLHFGSFWHYEQQLQSKKLCT